VGFVSPRIWRVPGIFALLRASSPGRGFMFCDPSLRVPRIWVNRIRFLYPVIAGTAQRYEAILSSHFNIYLFPPLQAGSFAKFAHRANFLRSALSFILIFPTFDPVFRFVLKTYHYVSKNICQCRYRYRCCDSNH